MRTLEDGGIQRVHIDQRMDNSGVHDECSLFALAVSFRDALLARFAYTTVEALAALNEAAGMPASHPVYQKGLRYLLATQSRRHSFVGGTPAAVPVSRPYLESGLAYGHDQFMSAMATC